jgi:NADH-quinone oxidoreductase subunit K
MMVTIAFVVASALAVIGISGVILRRNPVVMLISTELILNAANIILVASDRMYGTSSGSFFVLLMMPVIVFEILVALAILVALFRGESNADVDELSSMSG